MRYTQDINYHDLLQHMTINDLELFCLLDFDQQIETQKMSPDQFYGLRDIQCRIAKQLSQAYATGVYDPDACWKGIYSPENNPIAVDRTKAKELKFSARAQQLDKELGRLTDVKPVESVEDFVTPDDVMDKFGWYTSIRLFLVRFNRVVPITNAVFSRVLSIAGFSYGLEFLVELGVVLYSTFRANTPEEDAANVTRWQRFKNTLLKPDRVNRMLNAAVWCGVNVAAFILTGGASIILNLCGFSFDVFNEISAGIIEYKQHKQLHDKLTAQIKARQDEQTGQDKPESIEALNAARSVCKQKMNAVLKERVYRTVMVSLILVGMVMVWFPPTMIPGAFLIGSGLALGAGSVCMGLGRRLWNKLKKGAAPAIAANTSETTTDNASGPKLTQNQNAEVTRIRQPNPLSLQTTKVMQVVGNGTKTADKQADNKPKSTPASDVVVVVHGKLHYSVNPFVAPASSQPINKTAEKTETVIEDKESTTDRKNPYFN